MTTDIKDTKAAPASLAQSLVNSVTKANMLNEPGQIDMRAAIIKGAYESTKADHALKTKVFIYYVQQVKKNGLTNENVLTFFKQEIDGLFDCKKLKEIATDDTTKEKVDSKAVYNTVRRLLTQAAERFSRAGNGGKGPDENKGDPLAAIRSTFEQTSISNLADAFYQIKTDKRKEEIIRALFEKLSPDLKVAMYMELEEMQASEEA